MDTPIELIEDFSEDYFSDLWNGLPWERRDTTPRKECWMNDYNREYTYGAGRGIRTYYPVPWNTIADSIRKSIFEETGHWLDACFINGYNDHRDHLGWHADDSPEIDDNKPIAVVTFGAEREICFRPKGTKGPHTGSVVLKNGSLLLMKPFMQNSWEHRIPKHSRPCGPRISLTYRGLVV